MFDKDFFRRLFNLNKPKPIVIRIPSNSDIDKVHVTKLGKELLAYNRVRSIANANIESVNWGIAMRCLSEDVYCIYDLITDNKLRHPEELKEFIENCCAIYEHWSNVYREAFDSIKNFNRFYKAPKSIDDMDADELREFIRSHNLK